MAGTDLTAAGRRAGHGPRRPAPPGDRWSRSRRQPRRGRGQAPPGGDSQLGLSTELKSGELSTVAVGEVDQMWSADAPVGRGGGTSR
jgi:hypothetical protein